MSMDNEQGFNENCVRIQFVSNLYVWVYTGCGKRPT